MMTMVIPLACANDINDCIIISVMSVGFTSTTFTGTETVGHAPVCVEVLNPPSGGAIQPFSLTILPGEGIYIHSKGLYFDIIISVVVWHYGFIFR